MTTTKIINIRPDEILEHYVSISENCTILEARKILESPDTSVEYGIRVRGTEEESNYEKVLYGIEITIEK